MNPNFTIEELKTEIKQVIEDTNKKEFKKVEEEFKKVATAINENDRRIRELEIANKHCF